MPVPFLTPAGYETQGVQDWGDEADGTAVIPFYPDQRGGTDPESAWLERKYLCPWNRRQEIIRQLVGYPQKFNGTKPNGDSTVYIARFLPEQIDNFLSVDNLPYMYCVNADWEPLGGGGYLDSVLTPNGQSYRAYDYCLITAMFRSLPYNILKYSDIVAANGPDPTQIMPEAYRYLRRTPKTSLNFLTADNGYWVYKIAGIASTNSREVGNKVAYPIPQGTLRLELYDYPSDVWSAFEQNLEWILGCTNVFDLVWNNFPPTNPLNPIIEWTIRYKAQTLIFTGWDSVQKTHPAGRPVSMIGLDFIRRPKGVNNVLSPSPADWTPANNNGWVPITDKASGTKSPIQLADLSLLFSPWNIQFTQATATINGQDVNYFT